jgi:tripartite-type tricarboxylate transporter receptor subunit TctC
MNMPILTAALPNLKQVQLRGIAVTGTKRAAGASDIPTIAESGLPGYDASQWAGIVAPAGVPAPIVQKLNSALQKTLADPQVTAQLTKMGLQLAPDSSAEFTRYIQTDTAKWVALVDSLHLKLD